MDLFESLDGHRPLKCMPDETVHLLIIHGACPYLQRSPSPLAEGAPSLVPRESRKIRYKSPQLIVHGLKLRVVLEPSEEGGYTVYVPSLPGCIGEGDTREEALENIREAIGLYLEAVEDDLVFNENAEQIEIAV